MCVRAGTLFNFHSGLLVTNKSVIILWLRIQGADIISQLTVISLLHRNLGAFIKKINKVNSTVWRGRKSGKNSHSLKI